MTSCCVVTTPAVVCLFIHLLAPACAGCGVLQGAGEEGDAAGSSGDNDEDDDEDDEEDDKGNDTGGRIVT